MPARSAWEDDAPTTAKDAPTTAKTWEVAGQGKFCLAAFATIAAHMLDLYVIVRLYVEGDYVVPSLMVFGLLYSRVNSTYRAIAKYDMDTDKAKSCAALLQQPGLVVRSFFKIDVIKAQYDVYVLKQSRVNLASLILTTIMSETMVQMYLKSIALMIYLEDGAGFSDYGLMLLSTAVCVMTTGLGLLEFEVVMAQESGYTCPPRLSGFALCHVMARVSELMGRCVGVATFVVFFPFAGVTAAVLIVEEVLVISFVILWKAVESPQFLSTMRSGRCGSCKLVTYLVVVMWPMYWCMHTQRYIESVPRPAFNYCRYYTFRVGFTFARALALSLTLHFHMGMDTVRLTTISFASMSGTLAWMVLFPIIRKMSARIKETKKVEATAVIVPVEPDPDNEAQAPPPLLD